MSSTKRKAKGEQGQAMIEFALILPVILLTMIGMLEFARAWNLHQVMTDAAREGARRAVIADTEAPNKQTQDSVKASMWGYLARAGYDPQYALPYMKIEPVANWKKTGENIKITLACPYRFFVLPFRPILMKTEFTMRNE